MLDKILDEPLSGWLKSSDPLGKMDSHIVLSSRIRLARNFKGLQFTNRNNEESLKKVDTMMPRCAWHFKSRRWSRLFQY